MKNLVLFLVLGAATAMLLTAPAHALNLPVGSLEGSFVDWGNMWTDANGDGTCETPIGPGVLPVPGDEDRFIANVNSFVDGFGVGLPPSQFNPGTEELTAIGYDLYVIGANPVGGTGAGPILDIYLGIAPPGGAARTPWVDLDGDAPVGAGGHLDAYHDTNPNFSPAPGPAGWGMGGSTPFGGSLPAGGDTYATVTDGTEWLSTVFVPLPLFFAVPGDTVMIVTGWNPDIGEATGYGYLNVIGGTFASSIQRGTYAAGQDGIMGTADDVLGADMVMNFDLDFDPFIVPGFPGPLTGRVTPIPRPQYGWSVTSDDPVNFTVIPTPSSVILLCSLATGLYGASSVKRRRH